MKKYKNKLTLGIYVFLIFFFFINTPSVVELRSPDISPISKKMISTYASIDKIDYYALGSHLYDLNIGFRETDDKNVEVHESDTTPIENTSQINSSKTDFEFFDGYKTISLSSFIDMKVGHIFADKYLYFSYESDMNIEAYKNLRNSTTIDLNPLWQNDDGDLMDLIAQMTIDELIGQMFMFPVQGTALNSNDLAFLNDNNIGGVILMGYNISSSNQVKQLSTDIQNTNQEIPLFIATDQEGGPVKRISWDTTAGQSSWMNLEDNQVCQIGTDRGELLRDLGINVNLSPVADLTNPDPAFINKRTISADPDQVSKKVQEYRGCHRRAGTFTTLKHFPGHGSTTEDSHFALPVVDKAKERWLEQDAIPFQDNLDAEFIMSGHLFYSDLDSNQPASLSHESLTEILRKDWGYRGLVISDDMNMLHTSTGISTRHALEKAINAGTDVILYVAPPKPKEDIIQDMKDLVEEGKIDKNRIYESVFRILRTKRGIM